MSKFVASCLFAVVSIASVVQSGCIEDPLDDELYEELDVGSTAQELSAPRYYAWVWAHRATAASYTPHVAYTNVSTAGTVNVRRDGVGSYTVKISNFDDNSGSPHVVAYGSDAKRCKIASWYKSSGALSIRVRCHNPNGTAADARYALTYTDTVGYKGAWLWSSNASASHDAPAAYSHNTAGGTNRVNRLSTGHYHVVLPGVGARGGNVQVTAYGTNGSYCKPGSWTRSGDDQNVWVRCYSASGAASDQRFTLLFQSGDVSAFYNGAFAWLDRDVSEYTPNGRYSMNSEDRSNRAARLSRGRYTVSFPGQDYQDTGVSVTGYGNNNAYCKVEQWRGGWDLTTVYTQCYTPSGAPTDSDYSASIFGGISSCITTCNDDDICSRICS